jgi:hypothetical protein
MINIQLTLRVGKCLRGSLKEHDSYDFEVHDNDDYPACDNINDFLNTISDPISDYAELMLQVNGSRYSKFLIGSFKKLKIKNKYQWIVTD